MSKKGKEEGVTIFQHSNGREFICEQYDNSDYDMDEKILKTLSGKSIEEQMKFYYISEYYFFYTTSYGEITSDDLRKYAEKLCDYPRVLKLLFQGDILIGAVIQGYGFEGTLLPDGRGVCTYYASDNNGSGTKDREDTAYLVFSDLEV